MYRPGEKIVVPCGVKVYSLRSPAGELTKKSYVVVVRGVSGVAVYWQSGYGLKWARVTDVKPAPMPLEVLASEVSKLV